MHVHHDYKSGINLANVVCSHGKLKKLHLLKRGMAKTSATVIQWCSILDQLNFSVYLQVKLQESLVGVGKEIISVAPFITCIGILTLRYIISKYSLK